MKRYEGNQKEWIKTSLKNKTREEVSAMISECIDMEIALERALYLIDENAYRQSSVVYHCDGFILTIDGYNGDISCHNGTLHNYETYGTVVDYGDVSRTLNPVEAIMALLRSSKTGAMSDKSAAKLVLKRLAAKADETKNDITLMRWAMLYVYDL